LKSGSLNLLEPSGAVQACNGIALPLDVKENGKENDGIIPSFILRHVVNCISDTNSTIKHHSTNIFGVPKCKYEVSMYP
jgi:hypothetical protein